MIPMIVHGRAHLSCNCPIFKAVVNGFRGPDKSRQAFSSWRRPWWSEPFRDLISQDCQDGVANRDQDHYFPGWQRVSTSWFSGANDRRSSSRAVNTVPSSGGDTEPSSPSKSYDTQGLSAKNALSWLTTADPTQFRRLPRHGRTKRPHAVSCREPVTQAGRFLVSDRRHLMGKYRDQIASATLLGNLRPVDPGPAGC